jgi:uncharacterized protein YbjT (DUF2867 family)
MDDRQNVERLILVAGATGKQGGAVARSLLDRGFRVRGLTRDPQKLEAQDLAGQGAEIVRGDLDDRSSIDRVLEGAYSVFSVQNFWETGYEREVQQGKTVADAAKAAGVEHFVYSSVGSAHRETGIPHFDSKWEVEEHVREIDLPYTILRPVFFMQNWEGMREHILGGTLAQPLDPDKSFQQVAVEDIGAFAAIAFERPEEWIGREVDLAGDEQTMPEIAETFGRVAGKESATTRSPGTTLRSRWAKRLPSCTGGSKMWAMRRTSLPCGKSTLSLLPSSGTSAATAGKARRLVQGVKLYGNQHFGIGIAHIPAAYKIL